MQLAIFIGLLASTGLVSCQTPEGEFPIDPSDPDDVINMEKGRELIRAQLESQGGQNQTLIFRNEIVSKEIIEEDGILYEHIFEVDGVGEDGATMKCSAKVYFDPQNSPPSLHSGPECTTYAMAQ